MIGKKIASQPDADDDFHMADTDEFETLGDADTDVLETLEDADEPADGEEDRGFNPYDNVKAR